MAIIKFKDLCCPAHSVKLVQCVQGNSGVNIETWQHVREWILEVHIEITSTVPHFRKFHYEREQECASDYQDLIQQLEDKGWGK